MNKLIKHRINRKRSHQQAGLTLVELLVAMGISTVVVMVAANLVVQSMQSRANAEELRRKRAEWNLARRFVEAEVSSATRIITDSAAINIPEECGISDDDLRMPLFSHWSGRCGFELTPVSEKISRSFQQPSMAYRTLMMEAPSAAMP